MKQTIVYYHDKCIDGYTSAWAHWINTPNQANVRYIPYNYGDVLRAMDILGNNIIMLDCSESPDTAKQICDCAESLLIIDHHKNAVEALLAMENKPSNFTLEHSLDKSGALLTWEYFSNEKAPMGVRLVSTRDLWKFEIDGAREFHASLSMLERDFPTWSEPMYESYNYVKQGLLLLKKERLLVEEQVQYATTGKLLLSEENDYVECSLCQSLPSLMSETGHKLIEPQVAPKLAVLYTLDLAQKQVKFSLRSTTDFDCSLVAKSFGGGGHPQASGFVTTIEEGMYLISEIAGGKL